MGKTKKRLPDERETTHETRQFRLVSNPQERCSWREECEKRKEEKKEKRRLQPRTFFSFSRTSLLEQPRPEGVPGPTEGFFQQLQENIIRELLVENLLSPLGGPGVIFMSLRARSRLQQAEGRRREVLDAVSLFSFLFFSI